MDYVAKKLVNIGDDTSDIIDLDVAVRLLTADLIRLKRMSYFAKAFSARVDRVGADTTGLCVINNSQGCVLMNGYCSLSGFRRLYHQNIHVRHDPSDSENSLLEDISGVSNGAPEMKLAGVYLVEPLRASSAVLKFSGTLGQRLRSDKRTGTILAFSHFVFDVTACQYMFCDLQGH